MKKSSQQNNTFFGGAFILAASIALVKIIGALYKIPLGRILGDVGFGHFNNAYAIYNLLLMVSTAGLPVAMSKTISEANALDRQNQVQRVFRVALLTFVVLGTVSSLVMFLFAQPLANLQGDSMAVPAVRVMSLSCFFVCTMSAFRGYAQGHSDMVPTAVSQVLEALTKLLVGLALAWYLLKMGLGSEFAAAGAIGGVTASGLISLLYLMIHHSRRNRYHGHGQDEAESSKHILKVLAAIAIPITLSSSVVPITTYLDTLQVQNLLQSALGYTEEVAVSLYGCYQKAITIYNLPSAFMVSLTACIVPAIAACITQRRRRSAGKIAESALRVGMLIACPAGVGLMVLSGPIIHLLYPETNQEIASFCLAVLGIASIFVCMMLLCNAILQANGFVSLPIWFIALGSVIKLVVNFCLVQQESVGIKGAPIGTLICFSIVALLELFAIKRVTRYSPKYIRVFLKPVLASGVMGAIAWGANRVLTGLVGQNLAVVGAIAAGGIVYVVLVLVLRIVSRDDLSLMPKGDKIAALLHIRN